MARYIDADAYIKYCEGKWIPLNIDAVKKQPTVDMVEIITNELAKRISDRLIQVLEANYEIIPKKPVGRCKDCKYSHPWYADRRICEMWSETGASVFNNDYCSRGERRANEESTKRTD